MVDFNKTMMNELIKDSHLSLRKRSAKSFHSPDYHGPRILALCMQMESYLRPHMHSAEFSEEIIHINGRICLVLFDSEGNINSHKILDQNDKIATVPAKTYHLVLSLAEDSMFFEVSQGPYDNLTYKTPASWAPEEGSKDEKSYLDNIKNLIKT